MLNLFCFCWKTQIWTFKFYLSQSGTLTILISRCVCCIFSPIQYDNHRKSYAVPVYLILNAISFSCCFSNWSIFPPKSVRVFSSSKKFSLFNFLIVRIFWVFWCRYRFWGGQSVRVCVCVSVILKYSLNGRKFGCAAACVFV